MAARIGSLARRADVCSHDERHADVRGHRDVLRGGVVNLRLGRPIEADLQHIGDDADDEPAIERDADRILAWEVLFRQRLVDHQHHRGTGIVARCESAAS